MAQRIAVLLGAVILGALASACGGEEGFTPPDGPHIAGNWQFSTTSTVAGTSPAIAGSISQSEGSLTGAVHVNGSSCFDTLATIALSGTLAADSSVFLISTAVEGQIISINGHTTHETLIGTYAIQGGCADGDQGQLTGFKVPGLKGDWLVRLWHSSGDLDDYNPPERWVGQAAMAQERPNSDGSFGVSGTVVNACGNCSPLAGTIRSGTFPSPSFMLGTSVVLAIEIANGTVLFRGTVNESGSSIVGSHEFVGGTHDGKSGPACLGRLGQVFGPCF